MAEAYGVEAVRTRSTLHGAYAEAIEARARANGLPSESRQIAQRSPGCTTLPPNSVTRSRAAAMSATSKYGRENESPGPWPRYVNADRRAVAAGLPPGALILAPLTELDTEYPAPEAAGPVGVVGRKLDQREGGIGHGPRRYGRKLRPAGLEIDSNGHP